MRNLIIGIAIGYYFSDAIDDLLGRSNLVKPEKPSSVTYQTFNSSEEKGESLTASLRWPANGTELSPERKAEINDSTPDNPVTVTWDEIGKMNTNHVKVHVGSGRFKLEEVNPA